MKRLLDIVIVILIAPLAIFLSIFVAIAIKLDSPGPIVYWSTRVGQYGKPFQMPKFRSMAVGAPVCEAEKNPETQSYITKVGAFIRKTSLDELPQLWCVLKGDMSLIGPAYCDFSSGNEKGCRCGSIKTRYFRLGSS